jgi:hypothetical protein
LAFKIKIVNLKLENKKCPHSLMDRMRACGVCDPGSIPGEGTNNNYLSKLISKGQEALSKLIK